MAGHGRYTSGKTAKFVKRFGEVGTALRDAAAAYASEVESGASPPRSTASDAAHTTDDGKAGRRDRTAFPFFGTLDIPDCAAATPIRTEVHP